ncbi:hypothetical protein OUZ56_008825 [Daphnia magna]|uniref:Uncharacterized protein n=1 Tax=Daphnia magna TaxID=35525 RepID=A0ABR0AEK2_9CRUS|nr:hypothetical protein OUZ56_008825 [Daphnia magna]
MTMTCSTLLVSVSTLVQWLSARRVCVEDTIGENVDYVIIPMPIRVYWQTQRAQTRAKGQYKLYRLFFCNNCAVTKCVVHFFEHPVDRKHVTLARDRSNDLADWWLFLVMAYNTKGGYKNLRRVVAFMVDIEASLSAKGKETTEDPATGIEFRVFGKLQSLKDGLLGEVRETVTNDCFDLKRTTSPVETRHVKAPDLLKKRRERERERETASEKTYETSGSVKG